MPSQNTFLKPKLPVLSREQLKETLGSSTHERADHRLGERPAPRLATAAGYLSYQSEAALQC